MIASELCLRIGPDNGAARVLFIPPLLEEANRTRRTLVLAMRALAAHGIAALLPDLPGQNESRIATVAVDLAGWRTAIADIVAAETHPVLIASVRGGALIDDHCNAAAWWRLAPVSGANLLRTMLRARIAGDREAGVASSIDGLLAEAAKTPLLLAGNLLSPDMVVQLQAAAATMPTPLRTITLGEGDKAIGGTPLWLRAEPGEDSAMADAIAADISLWMQTCGLR